MKPKRFLLSAFLLSFKLSMLLALLNPNTDLFGQGQLIDDSREIRTQEEADSLATLPFALVSVTRELGASERLLNASSQIDLSQELRNEIVRDLDSLDGQVDLFMSVFASNPLEDMSTRELDQLDLQVKVYLDQIEELMTRLNELANTLEKQMLQLQVNRQRWNLTMEQGQADATLQARAERIESVMQQIDEVRKALQDDLVFVLEAQNRLNVKKTDLGELQSSIRDQRAVLGETIFKKDVPGILKDLANLGNRTLIDAHWKEFKESIQTDVALLKSGFRQRMITSLLALIGLLGFALWFKRNQSRLIASDTSELSSQHRIFINSPVASALFLVTLVIRFLIPDLPGSFFALNLLLLMIPMAILMVRIYGGIFRAWVIVLVLLTTAHLLYEMTYHPGVILRILLLAICGVGIWLFSWISMRKLYKPWIKHKQVYRFFRVLVIIFLTMQILAIVANLAGTFRLAEFFALVPLRITIAGIAIQLATMMADAIIYTALSTNYLQKLHVIRDEFQRIYRKASWLIHFILLLVFLSLALDILGVKDLFYEWGRGVLTDGIKIGAVNITLGSITIFVFVIWLSILISRMISRILEKDVFTRVKAAKGVPSTIILMLKIVLITGGFLLAAAASGMKLTNLSIVLGAFSVGIGFGLQNIFNNMVSGIILAFERPIKVGDIVQVGELIGTVRTIGLRSSTVKSFDGAEVIVPNGNLISNEMINWTLSDSFRRMDIRVGVKYGTKPDRVIEIMEEIANAHEGVMKSPSPKGYFIEFGDSSLNFRLLAWAHLDNRLEVESELLVLINNKLAEAGIEIPFPQRDLHIRSDATKEGPPADSAGK